MQPSRLPAIAAALLAVLVHAGAGAAGSPASQASGLASTAWTLSALPGRTLLAGTRPTLRFEEGRIHGSDGCNRYRAPYVPHAAGFSLSAQIASTQMACPEPVMQQADAFLRALAAASSARVDDGRLVLLDATGTTLAIFAPQSQELAGTAWQVTAYNNGREAVVGVPSGATITLAFAADGRLSGLAGCNRYTAAWASEDGSIAVTAVASTRRTCARPDGVMETEAAFLRALEMAAVVRVEGDRLELRSAGDALLVFATRAEAAPAPSGPRGAAGPRRPEAAPVLPAHELRLPATFRGDPAPAGVRLPLGGEMVYFADAARFTECLTGRDYPMAMEGAFVDAERAYVAARSAPAASLYVTFEGAIVPRPRMEGEGLEPTVVVDRFIAAWPGERCERAMADASLVDTYWRIVRLGGEPVHAAEGRREPHLILRSDGMRQTYAATVGCNRLAGSYVVDGELIAVGRAAATRVACPPPLDTLEARLGDALTRAARWVIKGNTLELVDTAGVPVALLQAVQL